MFEKYGLNEKKMSSTKSFYFIYFTIVWENLIKIDSLVTEIQNFEENVCLILCINLFERYDQYEKRS